MARILRPAGGRSLHEITTRRQLLQGIDDPSDPSRSAKWDELLHVYRQAMCAYVARFLPRGAADEDAEDVVQAFLAACVEKRWLSRAGPEARFRRFLQHLLKCYVLAHLSARRARKRCPPPDVRILPLDRVLEVPDEGEAASAFDRVFAQAMVARALDRLRSLSTRYASVIDSLLAGGMARRLPSGVTPPAKHRALARFQEVFVTVLLETVADPSDLPREWGELAAYLP